MPDGEFRQPIPGDPLLAVLDAATAAHEAALMTLGVPPERIAAFHMARAAALIGRNPDAARRRELAERAGAELLRSAME